MEAILAFSLCFLKPDLEDNRPSSRFPHHCLPFHLIIFELLYLS